MIMVAFRHVKQLSARHSHTPSLSGAPVEWGSKGKVSNRQLQGSEQEGAEARRGVRQRQERGEIFLPFIQDTLADIAKTLESVEHTHKTQQRRE